MSEDQQIVEPGLYKHFKGKECKVYFCAKHSETLEDLVVYEELVDKTFWVRPVEMFLENVEVEGVEMKRFEYIGPVPEEEKEWKSEYLHALADYDNLKKNVAKEKIEMGTFAKGMAGVEFTAVYDNYKKALAHRPNLDEIKETPAGKNVEQWLVGVEYIKKQFIEALSQMGVEEIKTVGEKFDPAYHEAIGEAESKDVEPGIILQEVDGGYKMGDRVIKAARVIISK